MKIAKRIGRILLITLFWLGVWAVASWRMGKPLLFPSPTAVLKHLAEMVQTADFYIITANSLLHVLLGIVSAVALGCILAVITSRFSIVRELILPAMTVIKATPVASFILLALIVIGWQKVPVFITFLIVIPIVWTNLDEGLSQVDQQLLEVAKVYKMPFWRRLTMLTLPSAKPYFLSAMRASIGLAWKAGVAAEVLALPPDAIGTEIYNAKMYIEAEALFAWTLVVILLSLLIETLFSKLFQKLDKNSSKKEA